MLLVLQQNLGFAWGALANVTVPNVVGETQAQATTDIQAVGLTVTVTTAYSSTVAAGLVISQNPVGGTSVSPGSNVAIVVSLGPQADSVGGWNFYVDFEQMLRKKRQRQQEQDEAAEIQNELDRNIARLLHEQIKKDEERAELERIRGLVQRYKSTVPVDISSVRVLKAIETAQQKETFASYLKLQQEVERMLEDEEEQFLMLLASFD